MLSSTLVICTTQVLTLQKTAKKIRIAAHDSYKKFPKSIRNPLKISRCTEGCIRGPSRGEPLRQILAKSCKPVTLMEYAPKKCIICFNRERLMKKSLLLMLSLVAMSPLSAEENTPTPQQIELSTETNSVTTAFRALGSALKKKAGKLAQSAKDTAQKAATQIKKTAKNAARITKDAVEHTGSTARATAEKIFAPIKLKKRFDAMKLKAEAGDTLAQIAISEMYAHGWGTSQDFECAIQWLTIAANQEAARAQYLLGRAYQTGSIVAKDIVCARTWLEKAAKNGHKGAEKALKKLS